MLLLLCTTVQQLAFSCQKGRLLGLEYLSIGFQAMGTCLQMSLNGPTPLRLISLPDRITRVLWSGSLSVR